MRLNNDQITTARNVDILAYLEKHEADNLCLVSKGTWRLRDHDSLVINNGLWHWFSKGIGGRSALDFLIKVRDYSFKDAVRLLSNNFYIEDICIDKTKDKETKKEIIMPALKKDLNHVREYLKIRGISDHIIDYCEKNNLLKEDVKYGNCLFIGYDSDIPKYVAVRGTKSDVKFEIKNSSKQYSFSIKAMSDCNSLHVFESAIDLLSYLTILEKDNEPWEQDNYLSLGGVGSHNDEEEKIPLAMESFIKKHSEITDIFLHLDNDLAGKQAASWISKILAKKGYAVYNQPSPAGKDINEYLLILKERRQKINVK